jgi:hypothetical protein
MTGVDEHGQLEIPGLPERGRSRGFVARWLGWGAAGFVIAVVAGASATDAALSLAWGALLFGAASAVLIAFVAALPAIVDGRGRRPRQSNNKEVARRTGFLGWISNSWRVDALFVAVMALLALGDPLMPAFMAGMPLGVLAIGLTLSLIPSRWKRPPTASPRS